MIVRGAVEMTLKPGRLAYTDLAKIKQDGSVSTDLARTIAVTTSGVTYERCATTAFLNWPTAVAVVESLGHDTTEVTRRILGRHNSMVRAALKLSLPNLMFAPCTTDGATRTNSRT